MPDLIFVVRKQFGNKSNDYRFMDKEVLMSRYINPENDRLCIHEMDMNTIEVMMQ